MLRSPPQVRLGWYDAAPEHLDEDEPTPGEERVGGGKEALDELLERVSLEETNISRLNKELGENRGALEQLQKEVPQRIVSSQRLSQLKLTIKHQEAVTDTLRFKQQSRSKAGLMSELLTVWSAAIPADLAEVMREVFDLPAPGKEGKSTPSVVKRHKVSIDTLRRKTLETARGGGEGGAAPLPAWEEEEGADARYEDDEEDDEPDDEEDAPHVLDGDGLATPWRSLGALAGQVAANEDDDDEDDDDDDEKPATKEVVRKAQAELKDARSKRISVMKMVQDAATPKPGAGFGGGAKEQRGGRKAEGKREGGGAKARPSSSPLDDATFTAPHTGNSAASGSSASSGSTASSGYTQSNPSSPRHGKGGRRASNENADPEAGRRSSSARGPASKADKRAGSNPRALRPSTRGAAKVK